MKQYKWKLLSIVMVVMLSMQIIDQNMFLHVDAIEQNVAAGNDRGRKKPTRDKMRMNNSDTNGGDTDSNQLMNQNSKEGTVKNKIELSYDQYNQGVKMQIFTLSYDQFNTDFTDGFEFDVKCEHTDSPVVSEEPTPSVETSQTITPQPEKNTIQPYMGMVQAGKYMLGNADETPLDQVNNVKVLYNSIQEEDFQSDIKEAMRKDFEKVKESDDTKNWSVVCFTYFDKDNTTLEVYPMYIPCIIREFDCQESQENSEKVINYNLKTSERVRELSLEYQVKAKMGTKLSTVVGKGESPSSSFSFVNEKDKATEAKKQGIEIKSKNYKLETCLSVDDYKPLEVVTSVRNVVDAAGNADKENERYVRSETGKSPYLEMTLQGDADIMKAVAKQINGDKEIKTDYSIRRGVILLPDKNIFNKSGILDGTYGTDNQKELTKMLESQDAVRSVTFKFPISEGNYKGGLNSNNNYYSLPVAKDGSSDLLAVNGLLFGVNLFVLDNIAPSVNWESNSWTWKTINDATGFYENTFKVDDLNAIKPEMNMHWYVENGKIYLCTGSAPEGIGEYKTCTAECIDSTTNLYKISLEQSTESSSAFQLRGKEVILTVKDEADNVSAPAPSITVLEQDAETEMTLDGEPLTLLNVKQEPTHDPKQDVIEEPEYYSYFLADKDSGIQRYNATKNGDAIENDTNPVTNNLINNNNKGNHKILLKAKVYGEIKEANSCFWYGWKNAGRLTFKKTEFSFSDSKVKKVPFAGGAEYSVELEVNDYGQYTYFTYIDYGNPTREDMLSSANMSYDITAPEVNITYDDTTNKIIKNDKIDLIPIGKDADTTININVKDQDSGVGVYACYIGDTAFPLEVVQNVDSQANLLDNEVNLSLRLSGKADIIKNQTLTIKVYDRFGICTEKRDVCKFVLDDQAPEVTMPSKSWTWVKDGKNSYYENQIHVTDDNLPREDMKLWWYIKDDVICISNEDNRTVEPSCPRESFTAKYQADGNYILKLYVGTAGYKDVPLLKKNVVIRLKDLLENISNTPLGPVKEQESEIQMSLDGANITEQVLNPDGTINIQKVYYIADKGYNINQVERYDVKRVGNDLDPRTPVPSHPIQSRSKGKHVISMKAIVYEEIIEKDSYFEWSWENAQGETDSDKLNFEQRERVSKTGTKKPYVYETTFTLDREGTYQFHAYIKPENKEGMVTEEDRTVLYDMTAPVVEETYDEETKKSYWKLGFIHIPIGTKTTTTITITIRDEQTGIGAYAGYLNEEACELNSTEPDKASLVCTYILDGASSQYKNGKFKFYAYNKYGLLSGKDPVCEFVTDNVKPKVSFYKVIANNIEGARCIEDWVTNIEIAKTNDVIVELEEENFAADECKVYLLTNKEYQALEETTEKLTDADNLAVSWIQTEENRHRVLVSQAEIAKKKENQLVLYVVGQDKARNPIDSRNVLYLNLNSESPTYTVILPDKEGEGSIEYDADVIREDNIRTQVKTKVNKLDHFGTKNSETDRTASIKFKLQDDKLLDVSASESDEDVAAKIKEAIQIHAAVVSLKSFNEAEDEYDDGVKYNKRISRNVKASEVHGDEFPFQVDVSEIVRDESKCVVTECLVEFKFTEGYYENLRIRFEDQTGNATYYNEYWDAKFENNRLSAKNVLMLDKNRAFCVDFSQLPVSDNSIVYDGKALAQSFEVNINITNPNVSYAKVSVKNSQGTPVELPSLANQKLIKTDGVWKLKDSIFLDGNDEYTVELLYKDFAGRITTIERKVVADNKAPDVFFETLKGDTADNCKEVKCEKETYIRSGKDCYSRMYDFYIGTAALKMGIVVSDEHVGLSQLKQSLIQICKLPDSMEDYADTVIENEEEVDNYEKLEWHNIDNCVLKDGKLTDSTEGTAVVKILGADNTLPSTMNGNVTSRQNWKCITQPEEQNQKFMEILQFTQQGRYLVRVICKDEIGNGNEDVKIYDSVYRGSEVIRGIVMDTKGPDKANITYTGFVGGKVVTKNVKLFDSQEAAINDAKQNTAYKARESVDVTLTAKDAFSEKFTIKTNLLSNGSESLKKGFAISEKPEQNGKEKEYQGSITDSFRGVILYAITDKAGNTSYIAENVVIDRVAATIEITSNPVLKEDKKDGDKKVNDNFISSVTFTITVTDNFWDKRKPSVTDSFDKNGVTIKADGEPKTIKIKPEGSTKEEECESRKFKVTVNSDAKHRQDGFHNLEVTYPDDIKAVKKGTPLFCIDSKNPVIVNQYDDNTHSAEKKYYNKAQSTTLTLTEKNPVDDTVFATVSKNCGNKTEYKLDVNKFKGEKCSYDIKFDGDGYYQYSASTVDRAGNRSKGNVKETFVVDTKAPKIIYDEITFKKVNSSIFAKVMNYLSFKHFFNEAVDVVIPATDATSGVSKIIYYTEDVNNGAAKQKSLKGEPIPFKEIGKTDKAQTVLKGKFRLPADFKGTVYAKAVDFAGNVSNGGKFKNCGNVILKKQESQEASIRIQELTKPNENKFYNKDFRLKLSASESYDGIKEVSYQVGNEARKVIDLSKKDDITYGWSKVIGISAKENDSNDVKVVVSYKDNTGNKTVKKSKTYKVDVTKPVLSVTYNNIRAAKDKFYKEDRVARIRINELNFDPKGLVVKATRNGRTVNMKPADGAWTSNGNIHTANVRFAEDGDYEFSIEYTDMADNKASYVHNDKFTIDKTKPVVSLTYNDNRAQNNQYYAKARVATVTVVEHNFDASNVKVNVNRKDKSKTAVPKIGSWSNNGDRHTASITFAADGVYSVGVTSSDAAGNTADEVKGGTFTIDQTKPTLSISGVKNQSAYKGRLVPVISCKDTNFGTSPVSVTVQGYKNGKVDVKYKEQKNKDERVFVLDMFPQKKSMDDVYTVTVRASDKAGNAVTKRVKFSVNRFGSNYSVEDATTSTILNNYTKDEKDIQIEEVNVRSLKSYAVTCSKDGKIVNLEKDKDYRVEETSAQYGWKKYTYTILSKNFEKEGNYSICVSSKDSAGNVSNNEAKNQKLRFTIDKTAPTLTTAGIDRDGVYDAKMSDLDMIVNDNIMVDQVKLYLNKKEQQKWERDEIKDAFGELKAIIQGSDEKQNISIIVRDVAGNKSQYDITNFLITQNKWIQFLNNKNAMFGAAGAAGLLLAAGACFVLFRRKKVVA